MVAFWDNLKKSLGMDELHNALKDLQSEDAMIRKVAIKKLGEMNSPEVVDHLIMALDDPNAGVVQTAVEALGWLQNSKCIPRLLELVQGAIQEARIDLLGEISNTLWLIGTASIMPLLRQIDSEDPLIREFVVSTLAKFKDKKTFEPVKQKLNDPSKEVKLAAVNAIKEMMPEEAVSILAPLLNDKEVDIRVTVEDYFKVLGTEEAENAMKEAALARVNLLNVKRASRMPAKELKILLARHHPPAIEDSLGTYQPSKEDLEVARKVQERLEDAEKSLGIGNKEEAIYHMEKAATISGVDGAICYKLSYLYEEHGNKEKALEFAKEAYRREPDDKDYKNRVEELSKS
ncbi:MAG: HEAT repeat domain-containing protein [Candidatus Coatesbacteria bacterium]|nr:HEAT repeat domain-containing protein [Candidatus Coatesbacteria bacterium]